MGDISFGSTVGILKYASEGASDAATAIANNVANVNTPHFKRTDVSFKEALARTQPRTEDSSELALVTDAPNQIPAGPDFQPEPFAVSKTIADDQAIRVDGSNVDVDQEMAKLGINSSYAQTMKQLLGVQYSRIRQAIQGSTS